MRRSQLWIITPARVKRFRVHYKLSQADMARKFGVAVRTVIRWEQTGLPIRYGRHPISYEAWERFERTGSPNDLIPKRQ